MQNPTRARGGLFGKLYFQVCVAILAGVVIGYFFPTLGASLKPLGDGFIRLIRMLLAPVVFGTIVVGIAKMGNLREVGRVGAKALIYFEVVSTLALLIGLVVVNVLHPGTGMNVDIHDLDRSKIAAYTSATAKPWTGIVDFLMKIIPSSVGDAFARGDMLQVIFFSVLFGLAMARFRERTQKLLAFIEQALAAFFAMVGMVMRLAPLGALGGMAFTVGNYGISALGPIAHLMVAVYVTCILFIGGVLATIARASGVSLWKFLRYIREELVVVFATASTESVLPRMIAKMENLGCAKPVVGLVLPAGYMFNPDGTSIYLTMASIFIAQATNTTLSIGDQLFVLALLVFTSKGSAGVAGAGFIALATTLDSTGMIPVEGLVLLLGVDRFINEARALTNLIGNGVATIAVARWENGFDAARAAAVLDRRADAGETPPPP